MKLDFFGYEIDFFRCEIIFLPAPLNAEQPRHQALLTPQKLLRLISLGHTDVLKKAVTDSASGSDSPAMPDMAVREEKIQLAVEMLTCKACSEEGSEDVTVLLLNFSYSGPQTRSELYSSPMEN